MMTLTSLSPDAVLDPDAVEQARQLRAVPKAALARAISVTPRTYTRYLNEGFPKAKAAALSTVLKVPESFFSACHPDVLEASRINFRAGRKAQAIHRDAAIANGNLLTQLDSWIRSNYKLPFLDWHDFSGETPEMAAQLLRQAWGLGIRPAPNMVQLCESRGISVYGLTDLAKDVDAFSAWAGSQPLIFSTRQKTPERARFDIAHELGHVVLHHNSPASNSSQQEKEADAFASEFLIPRASLKAYLPKLPNLDDIFKFKAVYKVSAMATVVSLHRAGILSDASYKRRCAALNKRGFKTDEPDGMQHFERSRVFDQIFAKDNPKFQSRKDLAKHVNIPEDILTFGTFETHLHLVR